MALPDWHYTRSDLFDALQRVGIRRGDTVFVHVGLEALGEPEGHLTKTAKCELLMETLREAVGSDGTLLIPTYTFSFCNQQLFDVQKTQTIGGPWSPFAEFLEYFRQQPNVVRSRDPIHSVAGIGPKAAELLMNLPHTCFGEDSVHDRLKKVGGKICMIGLGLDEATFRHHAEELAGVPFRFKKLFTGCIREDGKSRKVGWLYNVRMLADNCFPDGKRLEERARTSGKCSAVRVGRSEILGIDSQQYFDLTLAELTRDPWFTARGPVGDPVELERARVEQHKLTVDLPPDASIEQMVETLWHLPRDIMSDGFDAALKALATQVPMTIHEYPSGTECWSWIIPEKWTCHEAYLETMYGKRVFSYEDHRLHVVSYSLPFEGVVSREELFDHLHVHSRIPEAIPYIFKYYERDWGLCCAKNVKDCLTDDQYRVVIRTSFSYDTLKVGEVSVPGKTDEIFYLCVHLCHPHQANDDLSGVIVGIKTISELLKRAELRYTYRLLVLPETIGSIAYLSHNENLIPKMKGGLYLEMLGLENPHGLQLSFDGNTDLDLCLSLALKQHDYHGWTGAYRTVIGNDERQFNGPGLRVPMLSLSRVLPDSSPNYPYREYHSSYDNPDLMKVSRLEDSIALVLRMIDTIEGNLVPVNKFKGEVFCSRYGVFVDPYSNPRGHRKLFNIMDHIDGTRSLAEIARACDAPFDAVRGVIDELHGHGLVDYR